MNPVSRPHELVYRQFEFSTVNCRHDSINRRHDLVNPRHDLVNRRHVCMI